MGKTADLPTDWGVLIQWTRSIRPGGEKKISPQQVCLEGLKVAVVDGARLLCRSIHVAKNPNVKHTCMEGPSGPREG